MKKNEADSDRNGARKSSPARENGNGEVEDRRLLILLRSGKTESPEYQEAWRELVERYEGRVFRAVSHLAGKSGVAEEIVQETFLELYRHARKGVVPERSLGGWLTTVAVHKAVRHLRNARREAAVNREREKESSRPDGGALKEAAELVPALLERLPEKLRLPTTMYFAAGMKQAEIAEQLGCSQVTVSERIQAALNKLRAGLRQQGFESLPAALPVVVAQSFSFQGAVLSAGCRATLRDLPAKAAVEGLGASVKGTVAGGLPTAVKGAAVVVCTAALAAGAWQYLGTRGRSAPAEVPVASSPGTKKTILEPPLFWDFNNGIPNVLETMVDYRIFFKEGNAAERQARKRFGLSPEGLTWSAKAGRDGSGALVLRNYRAVLLPTAVGPKPLLLSCELGGRQTAICWTADYSKKQSAPMESREIDACMFSRGKWSVYQVVFWTEAGVLKSVTRLNGRFIYCCRKRSFKPGRKWRPYLAAPFATVVDNLAVRRPTAAELREAREVYRKRAQAGDGPLLSWDFSAPPPDDFDVITPWQAFFNSKAETEAARKKFARTANGVKWMKNRGREDGGLLLDACRGVVLPVALPDYAVILSFDAGAFGDNTYVVGLAKRPGKNLLLPSRSKTLLPNKTKAGPPPTKSSPKWQQVVILYFVEDGKRRLMAFNDGQLSALVEYPYDPDQEVRPYIAGRKLLLDNVRLYRARRAEFVQMWRKYLEADPRRGRKRKKETAGRGRNSTTSR